MDWLLATVSIVISALVTWLFGRHYYLKTRAGATTMAAFQQTARQRARSVRVLDAGDAEDEPSSQFAKKWALRLIEAYEVHEIYQPELWVACRILSEVGDLLKGAFAAAQEAVMAEEAPQTTSPRYFELREEALRAELDKAKERLRADLDEAH